MKFSEIETDNIMLTQLAHTGHTAHRQSGVETRWTILQGYPKNLLKTLSPVIEIVFGAFYEKAIASFSLFRVSPAASPEVDKTGKLAEMFICPLV